MPISARVRELLHTGAAIGLAAVLLAGFAWQVHAASTFKVSQRDRTFQPGRIEIARGDTVSILNDDGELLHHAYVKSDTFNFDSGEQQPGSVTDIRFTQAGSFTVLCGIHPKMHLYVTVK